MRPYSTAPVRIMSTPLQHLSIEQKLQAMEQLWEDLRANVGDELSAAWHGDELARRETALARGKDAAEDWDAARQRIRDAAR